MRTRNHATYLRRRFGARSTPAGVAPLRSVPWNGSSVKIEEQREHRRYAVAGTFLRVTWLDANGDVRMEDGARAIDVSERGMAVQLPASALLLSRVRLESREGDLLGHGKVRYCRARGPVYMVGIEFTGALRWIAPEGPVSEPIPLCSAVEAEELVTADPGSSPIAAAGLPEELLWSEDPDGRREALSQQTYYRLNLFLANCG
jgi:hypothetical protein